MVNGKGTAGCLAAALPALVGRIRGGEREGQEQTGSVRRFGCSTRRTDRLAGWLAIVEPPLFARLPPTLHPRDSTHGPAFIPI
ncbi:hypothetical protein GQ53DRAFT_751029 [Thozetella sp. PMI_491]|nr:hypothetical protein GQ53DRAFT_751029 [Thozetella sp. PMI_491]